MSKKFYVHSQSFISLTKIFKFSVLSITKNLLWQEISQALRVTLGGIPAQGGVQPATMPELSRPWAICCSWSKMIDLEAYLNTSKASGSLFLTAPGYHVAICPPKSRVNMMRSPLLPLVVMV